MLKNLVSLLIRRYNVCTKSDFDAFIDALQKKCDTELKRIRDTADADGDDYITIAEMWNAGTGLYRAVRKEVRKWMRLMK